MFLTFQCPRCQQPDHQEITGSSATVDCPDCEWTRPITEADFQNDRPNHCLTCGCEDIWRQKDFPQRLGVAFVALGAILSTVAWAFYRPLWAIGILGGFALLDLVLYTLMRDVLVCYRCGSRHQRANMDEDHPRFDLETAERYRQEAIRLREARESSN